MTCSSSAVRAPLPLRRVFVLGALCLSLAGPAAQAAPRVGTHSGYTRLVFDLPAGASAAKPRTALSGTRFQVTLGQSLKTESGGLSAPGVRAYAVKGAAVTVTLAPGHAKATATVLPRSGAQPARLVVDVPTSAGAAKVPARPATQSTQAARPAATVRPASTRAVTRPRVVIDAGHGGIDPGMTSRWVTEKDVTLAVARRVRDVLRARGVDVVMVRDSDRHLSADKATDLDARSRLATTGEVSAYISIHVNAGGPSAQGIETYYFGQPLGGQSRSLAVAENGGGSVGQELTRQAAGKAQNVLGDIVAQAKLSFSRQLAQQVQHSLIQSTGAMNRGVHTDAFYVIRNPNTAAILTEIGFGSSPKEGPLLATGAYRDRVGSAIAQAILSFLHMD
ncbi:N-acetylmuramoyl-L-alanine amidase [uncultured Deinococcus sp.]|uniref:N-acetylmuramoyl-L-alanine amidase family protein n=1 Tax=uncultured Deinococcus sp. TaxID=158789 RepID=UPI00338F34BC